MLLPSGLVTFFVPNTFGKRGDCFFLLDQKEGADGKRYILE
jgi:hypothetical protein